MVGLEWVVAEAGEFVSVASQVAATLRHGSTISRTSAISAHEYHLHLI